MSRFSATPYVGFIYQSHRSSTYAHVCLLCAHIKLGDSFDDQIFNGYYDQHIRFRTYNAIEIYF